MTDANLDKLKEVNSQKTFMTFFTGLSASDRKSIVNNLKLLHSTPDFSEKKLGAVPDQYLIALHRTEQSIRRATKNPNFKFDTTIPAADLTAKAVVQADAKVVKAGVHNKGGGSSTGSKTKTPPKVQTPLEKLQTEAEGVLKQAAKEIAQTMALSGRILNSEYSTADNKDTASSVLNAAEAGFKKVKSYGEQIAALATGATMADMDKLKAGLKKANDAFNAQTSILYGVGGIVDLAKTAADAAASAAKADANEAAAIKYAGEVATNNIFGKTVAELSGFGEGNTSKAGKALENSAYAIKGGVSWLFNEAKESNKPGYGGGWGQVAWQALAGFTAFTAMRRVFAGKNWVGKGFSIIFAVVAAFSAFSGTAGLQNLLNGKTSDLVAQKENKNGHAPQDGKFVKYTSLDKKKGLPTRTDGIETVSLEKSAADGNIITGNGSNFPYGQFAGTYVKGSSNGFALAGMDTGVTVQVTPNGLDTIPSDPKAMTFGQDHPAPNSDAVFQPTAIS